MVARKGPSVVLQHGADPQILRNVSLTRKMYEVNDNSTDDALFPVARVQGPENQPATSVEHRPQKLQRPPDYLRDYVLT